MGRTSWRQPPLSANPFSKLPKKGQTRKDKSRSGNPPVWTPPLLAATKAKRYLESSRPLKRCQWRVHFVLCLLEVSELQAHPNGPNLRSPVRAGQNDTDQTQICTLRPGQYQPWRNKRSQICTLLLGMTAVWPTQTGLCKFGWVWGHWWSRFHAKLWQSGKSQQLVRDWSPSISAYLDKNRVYSASQSTIQFL